MLLAIDVKNITANQLLMDVASAQKTVSVPNKRDEDIKTMSDKERRMTALPGLAGIGLILTGIAGLIFAFLGGGGLSLLASALAFGIVFYVCFK